MYSRSFSGGLTYRYDKLRLLSFGGILMVLSFEVDKRVERLCAETRGIGSPKIRASRDRRLGDFDKPFVNTSYS